jgi:hypothetical protein
VVAEFVFEEAVLTNGPADGADTSTTTGLGVSPGEVWGRPLSGLPVNEPVLPAEFVGGAKMA